MLPLSVLHKMKENNLNHLFFYLSKCWQRLENVVRGIHTMMSFSLLFYTQYLFYYNNKYFIRESTPSSCLSFNYFTTTKYFSPENSLPHLGCTCRCTSHIYLSSVQTFTFRVQESKIRSTFIPGANSWGTGSLDTPRSALDPPEQQWPSDRPNEQQGAQRKGIKVLFSQCQHH